MKGRVDSARREQRARPFSAEHAQSVSRQTEIPRGLGGMLNWFLIGVREELPGSIHATGIWRDYVHLTEDRAAEGGSLLGSPALNNGFRAFLEGSPFATEPSEYEGHQSREGDDHYRTPTRAALARMNGRHFCSPLERLAPGHICPEGSTLARLLYRIVARDGDWESAGLEFVQASLVRLVTEEALHRLWRAYSATPPARRVASETAFA